MFALLSTVDGVAGRRGRLAPSPAGVAHKPEHEAAPIPVPTSVDRTALVRPAKVSHATTNRAVKATVIHARVAVIAARDIVSSAIGSASSSRSYSGL